jgi:hypothetical protein
MTDKNSTDETTADPDTEAYEAMDSVLFDIHEDTVTALRRAAAIVNLIAITPDGDFDVQECADAAAYHLREALASVDQLLELRQQNMPTTDRDRETEAP